MSFDSLLNITCTIEQVTRTQDTTTGQKTKAWATKYSGVKCRLDGATSEEFATTESVFARATHILFLRKRYTIKAGKNRIKIGSDAYNILLVRDAAGHNHHLELLLELIETK